MTSRLRLPAYARALLDNRRRGFHPLTVELIYGDEWTAARVQQEKMRGKFVTAGALSVPYDARWVAEIGNPILVLRPRDYAPGFFDFRCATGCKVLVVDHAGGEADFDVDERGEVTRWGIFYHLLGELGAHAASVAIYDLQGVDRGEFQHRDVGLIAYQARAWDAAQRRTVWPHWWSDDIEASIGRRKNTWFAVAGRRAGVAAI
jgi:hypothetical protein